MELAQNMAEKKAAPHLFVKDGIYYFCRRVPNDLRHHLEPTRVCRRLNSLSRAAMGSVSRVTPTLASTSAGGMFPMGSRSRRLLNQSTHSSVA